MSVEVDRRIGLVTPIVSTGMGAQAVVQQWHLARVEAPAAHRVALGAGVTVAVIDTGVDCRLDALVCKPGRDYVTGGACGEGVNCDGHGHGTHVSGIAAETLEAVSDGGTGLAPAATIWPLRVLDAGGFGELSVIARAIIDAANAAAGGERVVINMSLGGPQASATLAEAVRLAGASGAVTVAARGNDGDTAPDYPACNEPVIAVAATGADDRRTSWSSHGQCTDVAAPGDRIVSTWPGGRYQELSGTSMAAPVVAGIAALALSRGVRPADVEAVIEAAMDRTADTSIPGRVNARRALDGEPPTAGPSPTVPTVVTAPPYPGATRTATATRTTRPTATATPTATRRAKCSDYGFCRRLGGLCGEC